MSDMLEIDKENNKLIDLEFKLLRYNLDYSEIISAKLNYKRIYISALNFMLQDLTIKSSSVKVIIDDYIERLELKKSDLISIEENNIKKILNKISKVEIFRKGFLNYRLRNYKYLLILEAFYFRIMINQRLELDLFEKYCVLLKINDSMKNFLIENFFETLIKTDSNFEFENFLDMCTKKDFHKTCLPLFKNIKLDKEYSALPKYNIAVCATMSSGKSTFINALLGKDYIPSKNEACTAKITTISDNDYLSKVVGTSIDSKGQYNCTTNINNKVLKEWNENKDINKVVLETDLEGIKVQRSILSVHDTPGTNYSGDDTHNKITMNFLKKTDIDMIIYIMNAENISTIDNKLLLNKLKLEVIDKAKTKIVFLVNKIDSFDNEKEDDIRECLKGVKKELESYNYKKPEILPVSANAARLFKMALKEEKLSKKEIYEFENLFDLFFNDNLDLNKLGNLNNTYINTIDFGEESIHVSDKRYQKNDIAKALERTGIPLVELMIDKNINCLEEII